ncbi:AsmA family protein [Rhodopila sp.]|uniref:AsmA family protein n=1 Tax=Rhodopila sp. TaxID=2480087 RepID=UPI003D148CCB
MRSPVRIALIAVASVIALVVIAAGIFLASFDPNSLKPRIIDAVKRATGRDLALNGQIGLKASLWPTIEVRDVSFANPPGFSRPQMATLQSLELQLGLLPLLSSKVEIDRLVLIHPDILLETNPVGKHNWEIKPEVSPSAPAAAQPSAAAKHGAAVSVRSIQIQDGTLAYRDDRTGTARSLGSLGLDAKAASPDSSMRIHMSATYNGAAFTLAGDTGSLTRLQDSEATTPWPVNLALTVAGAKLAADGTLTHPLQGKGYDLSVNGSVPDLSALAPLLPPPAPPPLHDVTFAAKVADRGSDWPAVSALTLHVGATDLGAQMHGLSLARLDLSTASLAQGVKADAAGNLGNTPFTLSAMLGPTPGLSLGAASQPIPLTMTLQAAGTSTTAKATLIAAAGGFGDGAALRGLNLSSPDGDLSGDATLGLRPRPSLTATLSSNRIDLDALQAAMDHAEGQPAPQATPQPAGQPAAGPPPRQHGGRLFSDQPIPFGRLRAADADLKLTIGTLRSGEADYKAIHARAVLNNGKLAIDPFTADLPQGHMDAKLSADADQAAPPVHVSVRAPGLALKSILTAVHQPSFANGKLEVQADLSGAGATPHALAASLDGSLGLAMADGMIDNRLLGSIFGQVMNELNALNLVGRGGASDLRCFGARLDAHHGIATIRALALSSSLLTMTGSGTINLGDETLAVTLRPEVRIAGTSVVVPIQLAGPIQKPATSVNKINAAESNVGSVAGAVVGDATPLGIVGGLLGANKLLGGGDICTPAMAAARGQAVPAQAPPKPAPPQSNPAQSNPTLSNPAAELRKLFK